MRRALTGLLLALAVQCRADGALDLRLANVDLPDWSGDCAEESAKAHAAQQILSAILEEASLLVLINPRIDRHGRLVATVLADGQDVGERLVAIGLARPLGHLRGWCDD